MVKLKDVIKCLKLLGFDTNKIRIGGIKCFKYEPVFKPIPYTSDKKYYTSEQQVVIYNLDEISYDFDSSSPIFSEPLDGFGTAFYYTDDAANNNVLGLINFNNGSIYIVSKSHIKRIKNELKELKQVDKGILSITIGIDEFMRSNKKEKKNA